MSDKSMIIIGAGIAGLSAGCYAQMNGYRSRIYEMHNLPGGLCTSWKRKGYTIDLCIHWLVGSSPSNSLYHLWQEIGLIQGLNFINMEEFLRIEGRDGKTLIIYSDLDRLQQHMMELAPEDENIIGELINTARRFTHFEPPYEVKHGIHRWMQTLSTVIKIIPLMGLLRKWGRMSMADLGRRFKNPFLREAFGTLWYPEFSAIGLAMTLAWLHAGVAGYPIGGSQPMTEAVVKRYHDLGGSIFYRSKVKKILVENDCVIGVQLENGIVEYADVVISAADGHATIFDMLDGSYVDDKIRGYYDKYPTFPPILFIGLGVNRNFDDLPRVISGFSLPLADPIRIGEDEVDRLELRISNYDATLAPAGKTVLTATLPANIDYWRSLYADDERYKAEKDQVAMAVINCLDKRYPGLENQIQMVDVATPVTFERFTGNWKASWEGWLMTPDNGMVKMSKTLPGLKNFFMVGQWVSPGGGLPSGVMTGREVIQMLCRQDHKNFVTSAA